MMGQFFFGLLAGIVVGLVMEWVIDWTGLLPKASTSKQASQKRVQQKSSALPPVKNEDLISTSGGPSGVDISTSSPSTDEA